MNQMNENEKNEIKKSNNKYENDAIEKGERFAEDLSRIVNGSYDKQAIKSFTNKMIFGTHRTLQQGMGNCFLSVIKEASKQYHKGNYDLRNESFYKWCSEIVDKTDCEYGFPCV